MSEKSFGMAVGQCQQDRYMYICSNSSPGAQAIKWRILSFNTYEWPKKRKHVQVIQWELSVASKNYLERVERQFIFSVGGGYQSTEQFSEVIIFRLFFLQVV